MWKIAVLVLVGLALGLSFADVLAGHITFGTTTTGFIAKYHEQPAGTFTQDLSGAATDGKVIIFADDGGSFIRVVRGGLPDTQAVNVPLALEHKDMEGGTFRNGVFAVITSHTMTGSENQPFRRLTRFKLSEDTNQLKLQDEKSVDLRDPISRRSRNLVKRNLVTMIGSIASKTRTKERVASISKGSPPPVMTLASPYMWESSVPCSGRVLQTQRAQIVSQPAKP